MYALEQPRARPSLELVGDRTIDAGIVSTLSLDFDIRPDRKNGPAPAAVVLLASRRTYRQPLHDLRCRTDAPAVVLLDEADATDRVQALEAGADDILTVPCDPSELLARLRALMRRAGRPASEIFKVDDLQIDLARRIVRRGDRIVALSPVELALLQTLARHDGAVVPHDMLTREVWGRFKSKNIVHTFVSYLRAKLNRPGETELIHTVRGVGYALRAPHTADQPASSSRASTA